MLRHQRKLLCFELLIVLVLGTWVNIERQQVLVSELAAGEQERQPQVSTEEQKKAGQSQIQLSHKSSMNRYPDEYSAVQKYFKNLTSKEEKMKKLLSFGAATGEEAITLAYMYFNNENAIVFGVDLHQESLDKAKASAATHEPMFEDGKVTFFNGNDADISVNGPYDAIFANSVLCYHGTPGVNPKSIIEKYPFSDFEASLGYLDANLNVGGVLAIVNTNYHFSHSNLNEKYKSISQCSNFVPKVDSKSATYEEIRKDGKYDCVWVKERI